MLAELLLCLIGMVNPKQEAVMNKKFNMKPVAQVVYVLKDHDQYSVCNSKVMKYGKDVTGVDLSGAQTNRVHNIYDFDNDGKRDGYVITSLRDGKVDHYAVGGLTSKGRTAERIVEPGDEVDAAHVIGLDLKLSSEIPGYDSLISRK